MSNNVVGVVVVVVVDVPLHAPYARSPFGLFWSPLPAVAAKVRPRKGLHSPPFSVDIAACRSVVHIYWKRMWSTSPATWCLRSVCTVSLNRTFRRSA